MIPRRDPETVPVVAPVQLIKRVGTDAYGTERPTKFAKYRPFQTRNGLPVRLYEYRGTGYCMTEDEAEWWLRTTFSKTKDCTQCDL